MGEHAPLATDEVASICRELIRIDTSNFGDNAGPGERLAAEHVASLLDEVGIEAQIFESAPGRASVVAQWGNRSSSKPGLLVHGHLDVVPAVRSDWRVDPFCGEIVDGYLWGRGAVDMKDFDAIALAVVRERQRAGRIPDRPITLVFTADEEAGGGYGARFLVEEHPEVFEGCTEAIGEVGGFTTYVGGQRLYVIESGERGMAWVRLTASGTAGHGSMKHPDNAVVHLSRALVALAEHAWPASPGPSMTSLLDKVRELTGEESSDPDVVLEHFGPAVRMIGAGIRDSVNPTMLGAGFKHNVIPGEAVAYADGRFLPGRDDNFHDDLRAIVGDKVTIEPYWTDVALEFPFSGDLVDAMTLALHKNDPEAHIAPFLMSAGTDAKHWDRLGIAGYGFTPLRLPEELDFTALFHGVDERVPLDALEFGCHVFDDFLDLL